jgi:lysophospholipase L1-like esterase
LILHNKIIVHFLPHNEALRSLDAIVQLVVLDKDLAVPPGSPAEGSRYIVAASPSGAWAGQAAKIAAYQDGAWMFYAPGEGWLAWVADEDKLYAYSGTVWDEFTSAGTGVPLWGINTTADTTNRLALKSPASLFDNVGNGHQQKINKAAAGDTASQLFQTGYSGRAEYGLTGDDDFHVKVSPDGSAWTEALVVDRTTAAIDVKKSLRAQDHLIGAQATGPRVVAVGDSLTVGYGASNPYTALITYPTWNGQSFTVSNIGVNGRTMLDVGRLVYSNLNPLFASESGLNIAVVWAGTNDLATGASPENTYSYLAAACRRLRGQGWRVVVATMISRTGNDAGKNTYNGYIRSGWPMFADAIADLGANANIGVDGAYASSTYFQADGTHLKDAGLNIVAGLVQTVLTTLAQGTPNWLPPFGNIGIGTIVNYGTGIACAGSGATLANFGSQPALILLRGNGTEASPTGVLSGQLIGHYLWQAFDSSGTKGPPARVAGFAAENHTNAARGTYFTFDTTPIGSTTRAERLRIDHNGNIGVGNTAPAVKLDVEGPVRVKSYTVAGVPAANVATGQIIFVSDESGGAVMAFSDGTNWRRVTDRAVIS